MKPWLKANYYSPLKKFNEIILHNIFITGTVGFISNKNNKFKKYTFIK